MYELLAASWGQAHAQVQQAGAIAWGTANPSLIQMAGRVVNVLLSLLGLVFLGFSLYGGYKWMMARGNDKEVVVAKDTLKNALIGVAITATAFAATNFIMARLDNIQSGEPIQSDTPTPPETDNIA